MCIKRLRTYYFTMNVIAIRAPFTTRVHRNVKIRAICDPDQYDTEINSARGFSHQKIRMKPVTQQRSNAMFYDPDQYDPEANQRSVLNEAVQLIDEISKTGDVTFGEVIEAEILANSAFVNKNINQIELPKSIRIGAILRKNEIIIPNSETIFQANDDVVFFCETKSIKKLEQLLAIK